MTDDAKRERNAAAADTDTVGNEPDADTDDTGTADTMREQAGQ